MKKSEALSYFGLISKPFAWNAESGNDLVKVNREGEGQVSVRNGYSTLYSNNENKKFMRRGEWNYMFRLISSMIAAIIRETSFFMVFIFFFPSLTH